MLDLGCGTGAMTAWLASAYPDAEVIGVDIAPIPDRHHKPNVEYVQGNVLELMKTDSRFQQGSFDYIFQRFLIFGLQDWKDHFNALKALLRPGGWLESQEASWRCRSADGSSVLNDGWQWYTAWKVDSSARHLDVEIGDHLREILQNVSGLQNVDETVHSIHPCKQAERPELDGIQGQIEDLVLLVVEKTCSTYRTNEEVEALLAEIRSIWTAGFEPGDHYRMSCVVAQRQAD